MHADDAHKLAEQHFATLVAALEAGRSDALVRYLETASRFHTYSFRNQCLIAASAPPRPAWPGIRRGGGSVAGSGVAKPES